MLHFFFYLFNLRPRSILGSPNSPTTTPQTIEIFAEETIPALLVSLLSSFMFLLFLLYFFHWERRRRVNPTIHFSEHDLNIIRDRFALSYKTSIIVWPLLDRESRVSRTHLDACKFSTLDSRIIPTIYWLRERQTLSSFLYLSFCRFHPRFINVYPPFSPFYVFYRRDARPTNANETHGSFASSAPFINILYNVIIIINYHYTLYRALPLCHYYR